MDELARIEAAGQAPPLTLGRAGALAVQWAARVLDVEPGAAAATVKKAYHQLALAVHPDKLPAAGARAKEGFCLVERAFEIASSKEWLTQAGFNAPLSSSRLRGTPFARRGSSPVGRRGRTPASASTAPPPRPPDKGATTGARLAPQRGPQLAELIDRALNDALRPFCLRQRLLVRVEDHAAHGPEAISAQMCRRFESAGCIVRGVLDHGQQLDSCGHVAAALLGGLRLYHELYTQLDTADSTEWFLADFPDLLDQCTVDEVHKLLGTDVGTAARPLYAEEVVLAIERLTHSTSGGMPWWAGALSLDNFWRGLPGFCERAATMPDGAWMAVAVNTQCSHQEGSHWIALVFHSLRPQAPGPGSLPPKAPHLWGESGARWAPPPTEEPTPTCAPDAPDTEDEVGSRTPAWEPAPPEQSEGGRAEESRGSAGGSDLGEGGSGEDAETRGGSIRHESGGTRVRKSRGALSEERARSAGAGPSASCGDFPRRVPPQGPFSDVSGGFPEEAAAGRAAAEETRPGQDARERDAETAGQDEDADAERPEDRNGRQRHTSEADGPPTEFDGLGWDAIDDVSLHHCLQSPFVHFDDVPKAHVEAWAVATVDVLELLVHATTDVEVERGLKWLLLMHDLLLRLPPRGGRRGHALVAHRFDAWRRGDMATLVRWWRQDRSAAQHPLLQGKRTSTKDLQRALFLLSEGHISRASSLLISQGLADLTDPRVLAQLAQKHPGCKEAMPEDVVSYGPFRRITVDLLPALKDLQPQAGTGASGARNEYLKALTEDFPDARARTVVPLLNLFAEKYVNADLPEWFYAIFTAIKLIGPVKAHASSPEGVPDVRPIGVGECLRRVIHTTVARDYKDAFAEHLWPQQVAVGLRGGLTMLLFGARLLLEWHPDWVILKLDLRNAYNEVKRARVLERLAATERLRDLVPLFHATHKHNSRVVLAAPGLPTADFTSAEGVQQGDGLSSGNFCVAIHPEVCELDAALAPVGGCAKFDMDDGYAIGPAELVFPAVHQFAAAIEDLGLQLQVHKCQYYCPRGAAHVGDTVFPRGCVRLPDGSEAYGLLVGNVPVGDDAYVHAQLQAKTDRALSKITTISSQLRDVHLQSLHCVMHYALHPLLDYWLQHSYPHHSIPQAALLDAALLAEVQHSMVRAGAAVDELTVRRLRLPARLYGCGLRERASLAPAAFVASACRALPLFLHRLDADGGELPGFLPQLGPVLGAGSFDVGEEGRRFAHLLSGSTDLGLCLASAWEALQRTVGDVAEGPLAVPASSMGAGQQRMQHALTRQLDLHAFQQLDVDLRQLHGRDPRLLAWRNLDAFSTVWVTAWPDRSAYLSNAEFLEVFARYLGLPSPACAAQVGERLASTRARLDPYGFVLCATALPGDGWRTQHDGLKWRMVEDSREMGVTMRPEVYGLFASCIPPAQRETFSAQPPRQRQGLVPDMMAHVLWTSGGQCRDHLLEVKTLHVGSTTYPSDDSARCAAVAARAADIPSEYVRKAHRVDVKFCGTAAEAVGPVEAKLRTFDPVHGLVFGAYGEASPAVHNFLDVVADVGCRRHKRAMRADTEAQARAGLIWLLRRRWGMEAVRSNARLLLGRMEHVGRGAGAAAARRQAAQEEAAARGLRGAGWHARQAGGRRPWLTGRVVI